MKLRLIVLFLFFSTLIGAKELEKVSLQLQWKHQFQFAGYYIAKEKGFYKEAGLDVDLLMYDNSIKQIDKVLNKNATYGIGRSSLIIEKSRGKDIVLLSAIFQSSPSVLIARKNSGIKTIKDFIDRKIMITKDVLYTTSLLAMTQSNGFDLTSMQVQEHSFDVEDLINGTTDLMSSYISNEPFLLKQRGIPYTIFDPKEYDFDFYSDILFTSSDEIKNNPKRTEKFINASLRGWKYAFEHIEETVELILQKYNTQNKTREALIYEAKELKKLAYFESNELGYIEEVKIQKIYNAYNVLGLVKNHIDFYNFIFYQDRQEINLTKKEKSWLKTHPIVTYSEIDWKPLSIIENNKMKGIMGDFLDIVSERSGLEFRFIPSSSWNEVLEKFENKKIDLVPSNPQYFELGLVSDIYKNYPMVIVTGDKFKFIDNLDSIKDKTVAMPKNYTSYNFMKENYPYINIITTKDIPEALTLVHDGKADAFIGHIATALYYLSELNFTDLKISGRTGFPYKHSYLIQKEYPELLSIINKALRSITQKEKNKIYANWTDINEEQRVDYTLIKQILFFSLIVFLFFLYKNYFLKKRVKKEVEKNKEQQLLMFKQSRHAQMGEMISMIAHQWRQPLNNLSLMVQGMTLKYKKGSLDDEFMDEFKKVSKKQIMQMTDTIDDFRDFFKPEKEMELFDMSKAVKNALELLRAVFKSHSIEIDIYMKKALHVKGYPNELGQALINIFNNSKDAFIENNTQKRVIKIRLKRDNKSCYLSIEDNGGRIEDDVIDKIFDPYFSTKSDKNGTGLGMYMTKMIIEDNMNGSIEVSNTKDGVLTEIRFKIEEIV